MFDIITPEEAGISSEYVTKFIKSIERKGLVNHSILMLKGDRIFAEYYWKPFGKDICHRMYSQTKSYVSIAIGLLYDDGKISLDDKISKYFPEKIDRPLPEYLRNMTVKDMLTMQTCGETPPWFFHNDPDRTHLYFAENEATIPSGMRFSYDSPGSQVLCTLVEKLSGKSLFDFLNERIFKYLGTFKTASILKTKNNDSFGDSALICTSRDMASFALLLMKGGVWNGKRLISEEYVKTATSRLVSTNELGFNNIFSKGYGYQIWRTDYDGFAFNGMGVQLTICIPKKDIIFVCTGDNQGFLAAKSLIVNSFYDLIVENLCDSPMPKNEKAYNEAMQIEKNLELYSLKGEAYSDFQEKLSGKKYICEDNITGIKEFSFEFEDGTGKFIYKNAQGEKTLMFGMCKNVYGHFPQLGYSDIHTGIPSENPNFMYKCASSACWTENRKLIMYVQIIDTFLGNLFITFSFKENIATVTMKKNAEAFLEEYNGEFVAKATSV